MVGLDLCWFEGGGEREVEQMTGRCSQREVMDGATPVTFICTVTGAHMGS